MTSGMSWNVREKKDEMSGAASQSGRTERVEIEGAEGFDHIGALEQHLAEGTHVKPGVLRPKALLNV